MAVQSSAKVITRLHSQSITSMLREATSKTVKMSVPCLLVSNLRTNQPIYTGNNHENIFSQFDCADRGIGINQSAGYQRSGSHPAQRVVRPDARTLPGLQRGLC